MTDRSTPAAGPARPQEPRSPARGSAETFEAGNGPQTGVQVPCSHAFLGRLHGAHDWEPQPGVPLVRCPGVPAADTQPAPDHREDHPVTTTDPTIADLRRELAKAREALAAAESYLARHAEMNAALHCAERVMHSPLHAKVAAALTGIDHALARTEQPTLPTLDSRGGDGPWAALAADLDRCMHGRHEGDDCGDCGGRSRGNHHLRPGTVIGYGLRGDHIVMPDREHKHDPAAWRAAITEGTTP